MTQFMRDDIARHVGIRQGFFTGRTNCNEVPLAHIDFKRHQRLNRQKQHNLLRHFGDRLRRRNTAAAVLIQAIHAVCIRCQRFKQCLIADDSRLFQADRKLQLAERVVPKSQRFTSGLDARIAGIGGDDRDF